MRHRRNRISSWIVRGSNCFAHALKAEDEPTYDVQFRTEDLWPNSAESALVHVGVFQSYLERDS